MVLTTNYTISNSDRSDRRRQFFVPIGTFYGTLYDRSGFTPADIHDGYLLDKRTWSDKDWSDFYATCIHCVKEYLDQGLVPFDDTVLVDRQLLKSVAGRDDLLTDLTSTSRARWMDLERCPVRRSSRSLEVLNTRTSTVGVTPGRSGPSKRSQWVLGIWSALVVTVSRRS